MMTLEQRKKISDTLKKRGIKPPSRFGMKLTVEQKKKHSESMKLAYSKKISKRPRCVDCDKIICYGSTRCQECYQKNKMRKGVKHKWWKGDKVGYHGIHRRIIKEFGRHNYCEICKITGKKIQWANKSGRYLLNRSDWLHLCVSCHSKYDKLKRWVCRTAPSLGGGFSGDAFSAWDTMPYNKYKHINNPTVFFGLYGLPDFYDLWRHKGLKAILWAGSDIRHLKNGYWLDKEGKIRIPPEEMAKWINENCQSYVENGEEKEALKSLGIDAKVVPSFLGNVSDYKVEYKWSERPKVYSSVSGNDFNLYKWHLIDEVAKSVPEVDFYLYGNTEPFGTSNKNVIVKGKVTQEVMNDEIKQMQGALRMIQIEGCSEIIVKSALWGQWPISRISYPNILNAITKTEMIILLKDLINKKEPDLTARNWFLENVNRYPWNNKL